MIEIKEGWTAKEASAKHEIQELDYRIKVANRELAEITAERNKLVEACDHKHVLFTGQGMTCEVCNTTLVE